MTTELKQLSDCKKELTITATADDYKNVFNEKLKAVQKQVKMPGFRPGKVPTNIVLQQYGASLKYETQEELANRAMREYFEKSDSGVLGTPILKDIKENDDKTQTYIIEFECIPDFELKDYKSLEIYEPTHTVTDKEVEEELKYQAKRLGTKIEQNDVTDNDCIVTIDSYELGEGANPEPYKDIQIDLSTERAGSLRETLSNARVGDEIEHTPTEEDGKKYKPEKIVVKKIEKVIPREIDDELAKAASNGRLDNLDDFKQDISFHLQKEWDDRAKQMMEEEAIDKIVRMHEDFELPEILIEDAKKQMATSYKQQNPGVDVDAEPMKSHIAKMAESLVRIELVRKKIIDKEDIKLEDYDYENFVNDFYAGHPEFEQAFAKDMMLTQIKSDERMQTQLLQKKFMDLLMDFTKTNPIDFDEYTKMKLEERKKEEELNK